VGSRELHFAQSHKHGDSNLKIAPRAVRCSVFRRTEVGSTQFIYTCFDRFDEIPIEGEKKKAAKAINCKTNREKNCSTATNARHKVAAAPLHVDLQSAARFWAHSDRLLFDKWLFGVDEKASRRRKSPDPETREQTMTRLESVFLGSSKRPKKRKTRVCSTAKSLSVRFSMSKTVSTSRLMNEKRKEERKQGGTGSRVSLCKPAIRE
jgi:hypothetical protein